MLQVEAGLAESSADRSPPLLVRVALRRQFERLVVNGTAAHSPTTFFSIWISSDFRPSVRSSCRMRRALSLSDAAALPPKRCLRSLFRFIIPATKQIRSDPLTPTRLRDAPALRAFLHDLPLFLFRGSIYSWFSTHVASCLGGPDAN